MKQRRSLSLFIALVVAAGCIFSVSTFGKDVYNIVVSPQNFVVNGKAVSTNALNINDYNYIKIAEFAKLLDIDVSYNEITGTVTLDKAKPFEGVRIINAENPYYLVKHIQDLFDWNIKRFYGFTLEYVKTEQGYAVVECTGDYKSVVVEHGDINGTPFVSVQIYQNIVESSNIFGDITKTAPLYDGETQHPDNEETWKSTAKYYRVFANGKQILGSLMIGAGNGSRTYRLTFDTPIMIKNGDRLRIEIGYQ